MDIEQLTKMQIVLLTLLVSFVTSIATGIVTVTLVDQAPPEVTQTINRVVERTVERVVPEERQTANVIAGSDSAAKEVTVVVKESELITDAVAKVGKSFVRIYAKANESSGTDGVRGAFLGLGLMVSREGLVVTDAVLVAPGETYVVVTADNAEYEARLKNESAERPTAILALSLPLDTEKVFLPVAFADSSALKLGQTVLTISGKDRTNVATGIVSEIISEEDPDQNSQVSVIVTSMEDRVVLLGAPLVDTLGEVTGIYTSESMGGVEARYTPSEVIKAQLEETLGLEQEELSE